MSFRSHNEAYMRALSASLGILLLMYLLFIPPAIAQSEIELTGELFITIEENHLSGYELEKVSLKTEEGNVRLHFNKPRPAELAANVTVRVKGQIVSDSSAARTMLVSDYSVLSTRKSSKRTLDVQGQRAALAVRVNFNDRDLECSLDDIRDHMWDGAQSLDGLYQASSYGALSFPRDTNNDGESDAYEVTISASISDPCDYNSWATKAEAILEGNGIDLSIYQHLVFFVPEDVNCVWQGVANYGCDSPPCRAWSRNCGEISTTAHELGHNLGMLHAGTDRNNDGFIDCGTCDWSSVMGAFSVGLRHFNIPHKVQMGWLPDERQLRITESGNYTVAVTEFAPTELDPTPPSSDQALRISIPDYFDNWDYFLSYRVRSGDYSTVLAATYRDKVNIHRFNDERLGTLFVEALEEGESWTDGKGVSIEVTAIEADYATVNVIVPESFSTPTPTPTPTATPSPGLTPTPPSTLADAKKRLRGLKSEIKDLGSDSSLNQQILTRVIQELQSIISGDALRSRDKRMIQKISKKVNRLSKLNDNTNDRESKKLAKAARLLRKQLSKTAKRLGKKGKK